MAPRVIRLRTRPEPIALGSYLASALRNLKPNNHPNGLATTRYKGEGWAAQPARFGRCYREVSAPAQDELITLAAHAGLGTTFTPQISSAYWRIVRSLEKRPMPATFRIAFAAQACSSR